MSKTINRHTRTCAPLVFMLALIAGCGEETEIQNGCDLLNELSAGSCRIIRTEPDPVPQPPASTTPPADTTGGSEDSGGTGQVRVTHVTEWEPNSTLNNANPVSFADKGTADAVAIDIEGSVRQDVDVADFFIFTPVGTGTHLVYLCGATCVDRVDTAEVYLMIYDQSQTTIKATPIGTASEQWLAVELTAGMAYYVEINGYGTGAAAFDYRLAIVD